MYTVTYKPPDTAYTVAKGKTQKAEQTKQHRWISRETSASRAVSLTIRSRAFLTKINGCGLSKRKRRGRKLLENRPALPEPDVSHTQFMWS